MVLNAAYTLIWADKARVDKTVTLPVAGNRLLGEFDSKVDIVTLSLTSHF